MLEEAGAALEEDPVVEGVRFTVKQLGETEVEADCGEETTATAIKSIITSAKKENK